MPHLPAHSELSELSDLAELTELTELTEMARAFPFHLVWSADLQIRSIGPGLARVAPDLVAGARLDAFFAPCDATGPLSWDTLSAAPDADICLVHRPTGLELRGRMVVAAQSGLAVFLGSSWLDDAEQLADFGVDIDHMHVLRSSGEGAEAAASTEAPPVGQGADAAKTRAHLVARCTQLEQTLRFQQAISRCLAETNDVDTALAQLTESLPKVLRWAGAVLWRKNTAAELIDEKVWPLDATLASSARWLAKLAFDSSAPAWSVDGCGGVGGFAIPIHGDAGTMAVITIISRKIEPKDDEFARQLYLSAGQLARYLARQQQTSRLKRLTSELMAIFQLSVDGFVTFNGQDVLGYLNPAFARMVGVDRDELRGISEAEFERRLAMRFDPLHPPGSGKNGQQIVYLSQPRSVILERSKRDARDIDGKLVGRLLYFRDITLETELLRANGEFLANAAHELRTPMASIHGFTELLLKREFSPDKRQTVLETIHSQTSRLREIVDELLEVARFDARAARDLSTQVQPLVPVIRSAVAELLVRNDTRQVDLTLPAPAGSPWVDIDRDRFVQALTNVLSNAYKYSPNGGAITLHLRTRMRGDQAWVGVAVCDRGIGMSEEELQHLFERFFRAHPSGTIPGTGLGMSMVKKIVNAHGGEVEVNSTPGQGTEITLWLATVAAP